MAIGPVELVVIHFEGNKFNGEILPALQQLVDSDTVRIIDVLFAVKDEAGKLSVAEMDEVKDVFGDLNPVVTELTQFLSDNDVERLSESLGPNSSAALILFEDRWALRFAEAVRSSGGSVVLSERIPRRVVEELVASHAAMLAEPA